MLLAERIENELRKNVNRRCRTCKKLSLYTDDLSVVIDNIKELGIHDKKSDMIITFCEILNSRIDNARILLNIEPELELDAGKSSYWYHELYSDEQLVRKVKRILKLSQNAI